MSGRPSAATERKERTKALQREANSPKSALLRLAGQLDSIAPRKAESLRTIIARLEDWQHK